MSNYDRLPEHMQEAAGRADGTNQRALLVWAEWLYNDISGNAWGSEEKVVAWMKARQETVVDHAAR